MLENNLPIRSMGIIDKFPRIDRTNMSFLYFKLLIFIFLLWNFSNCTDSSCNNSYDEEHCDLSVRGGEKFRVLTEYDSYYRGGQSSLYSLEDMEDDQREEHIRELISYYNVFLNYYPRLNTKDKIIKLKNPESIGEHNYASNGKQNVSTTNLVEERSYEYDEVDNVEDVEEYDELETFIEIELYEEPDDLHEYLDLDIDIDDRELTTPDDMDEDMGMFKQKYLELMDKIILYITNYNWNSELIYDYFLLFTPLSTLIAILLRFKYILSKIINLMEFFLVNNILQEYYTLRSYPIK
ncbi:hypothetical protein C922_04797 [Plasmodium inui San Antonio 1]|uniref:Uncharacterized protein n=1 Tax=Plasmodium inui San Antonio 1 TaxID=1237626 RepID=W7A6Y1_9APIC|nr:hypothetical protein C922_04797 [Plasmodium inui San Antonio 1]EUD64849.1 hypothetical protein C922_04797 [Plasmodium inui San Antonio 1]